MTIAKAPFGFLYFAVCCDMLSRVGMCTLTSIILVVMKLIVIAYLMGMACEIDLLLFRLLTSAEI